MHSFYTNVYQKFDTLYVRGYSPSGKRFEERIKYEPYLFEKRRDGDYKTISGEPVGKVRFDSMSGARKYLKAFDGVEGKTIYGITNFQYQYIYDNYGWEDGTGQIGYDPAVISVVTIDIEVAADDGFPDIRVADKEITAVTLRKDGKSIVLGCQFYREKSDDVTYVMCRDETQLLENLIRAWEYLDPDVVTGWNIEFFDVPYLVNRIAAVLGSERTKDLSPWKLMEEREIDHRGGKCQVFMPVGITILDYMRIYKKFYHKNQESYSLNNIASVELNEKKLDYSEFNSLLDLYRMDYEKFIDYNIHDTVLVDRLEEKLGYIQLVFTIAYIAKVNYIDTLATVRPWDMLIHSHLMDRKVVVPPMHDRHDPRLLVGGYVKEPMVGMHDWIVSFDLNSLYMHLVMQYNISPDTFSSRIGNKLLVDEVLFGSTAFTPKLVDMGMSMTANGCLFRKDKRGFLPEIAEKIYDQRSVYKKKMIEAKREYEKTKTPESEKLVSIYKNKQDAFKVILNSGYGAIANKYFRWFNFDFAEAITSSGQLSIRWIESRVNGLMNRVLNTLGRDYVIASDTDSIYVDMSGIVDAMKSISGTSSEDVVSCVDAFCSEKVQPFIDESFRELADVMNAYEQKMVMKREKICARAIWKAAKMYVLYVWDYEGVRYSEPEVEVTGIESVRSSTPKVAREYIKEALKIIMSADEATLQKFILEKRKDFNTLPFEQVAFPRGVKFRYGETANRKAGVYTLERAALPIQVRAALLYNRLVSQMGLKGCQLIASDEKMKFTYLRVPNPIGENVIGAPAMLPHELGLDQFIDHDMQFRKSFLEPIQSIVDTMGWNTEKVSNLGAFF
jgi:Kyanoviridae DNA polymerase